MITSLSRSIPFINTSYVVCHNSFANYQDSYKINPQQTYNLKTLFQNGVRGFMIDLHYHNNEISICHEVTPQKTLPGSCYTTQWVFMATVMKLESFLIFLQDLVIKNPEEIIILFLESYVPMKEVEALFTKTNLTQFILKTNPNTPGLTLGDILNKKTPLIVFSDYANPENRHLIDGFFHTKNYRESKYDLSEYQGCEDRGEASRTKYHEKEYNGQQINLFLLNHFYKTSLNFKALGTSTYHNINDYHSIQERGIKCQKEFSLFPNFIAVDYVEEGNWGGVFAYVNEQNYNTLCALTNHDCAIETLGNCSNNSNYETDYSNESNYSNYIIFAIGAIIPIAVIGLTHH